MVIKKKSKTELVFTSWYFPKENHQNGIIEKEKLRDGDKNLQERSVTRELSLSDSSSRGNNLTGKNGKKRPTGFLTKKQLKSNSEFMWVVI